MSVRRPPPSIAIIAILCFAIMYAANAQAPVPTPSGPDCMTALFNLSDCLTYVEAGSKLKKPDKACCPELAGLIDSNPICLCELLGGAAASFGISIDNARALGLPKVCHVETPPVSLCSVVGIPISAPMSGTPTSSPPLHGSKPTITTSPATTSPAPSSPSSGSQSFNPVDLMFVAAISYIIAFIGIFF
ncbi:non-specific lipid transfer protein GPI-anchored 12-like [Typha latifolia]|uniref:non-specific lipid transfer protein GPI-anchored 12-like n=1 Tax=Typha latifolia TaxID=4733 RepID=UPI003C2D16EF